MLGVYATNVNYFVQCRQLSLAERQVIRLLGFGSGRDGYTLLLCCIINSLELNITTYHVAYVVINIVYVLCFITVVTFLLSYYPSY